MFKKVPFNVFILGLVSFCNDLASQMVYPIVPLFLTGVLHAPVSVVGLIEGIAEGAGSVFKFFFGYLSDKLHKRKIFVVSGYGTASVARLIIGLATIWPVVLVGRVLDKFGKGLRTSARDSLLLQNARKDNKGFIFGFHRAMDSFGAIFGSLMAVFFMDIFKENLRPIFFIAFFVGLLGVVLLVLLVKEKTQDVGQTKYTAVVKSFKNIWKRDSWRKMHGKLKLFFIVSIIFSLGNSSDAFLILRAKDLGLTSTLTILAFVVYNISYTAFSTPAGQLADKIGSKRVFLFGLVVFSAVYAAFAWIHNPFWLWVLFPIYGIYIAFTDGVSKSYIADYITEENSGTFFGLYEMGISIAIFFASFIGGLLWSTFGASSTFYYGSIMALIAFLLLSGVNLVKTRQ